MCFDTVCVCVLVCYCVGVCKSKRGGLGHQLLAREKVEDKQMRQETERKSRECRRESRGGIDTEMNIHQGKGGERKEQWKSSVRGSQTKGRRE